MSKVIEQRQTSFMLTFATQLRAILATAVAVPFTFCMCFIVIAAGSVGQPRQATVLMRLWSAAVLWLFQIRVEATGVERLPEQGGGIIVFNHQSHFDIPAMMLSTAASIRFGAKIELFKIPFFGGAMRAVGTLPIARESRSEVLRTYQEAKARFNENTIFVLAPEGTRQAEPQLGRFKKGPFSFAISAQVPLIPVVIKGAYEVLPKKNLLVNVGAWSRTIRIHYLPAVETKELTQADVEGLLTTVRADMDTVFRRL
jgi:1-acyl-sn-glycerol-3-phosphate acyltransferase